MLIDRFGRRIEYLRVSVTDRCNYRCFYCMPAEGVTYGHHHDFLSYEELTRLIKLFSELGVYRVRLTGGEPLVRRHLHRLAEMIGQLPAITDLSLSTNGHLLARFASQLKQSGVSRVNISLDSLDPENFHRITRGGDVNRVVNGIDAALAAGMDPVRINMVVMKGVNDHEIESMFDFSLKRGVDLRFIETMPVGEAGVGSMSHYYPAANILKRIRRRYGSVLIPMKGNMGAGPARYYQVGSGPMKVGVISAISQHFCAGCNRVRLTANGELVLCLGKNDRVSLREAVRGGDGDNEIKRLILKAVAQKPERHEFQPTPSVLPMRNMSATGG